MTRRCQTLRTPADFAFIPAASSYGFCYLLPTCWDPARAALETVAPVDDARAETVRVVQTAPGAIRVCGEHPQRSAIARRMLRLDEDLSGFHAICRTQPGFDTAAAMRFGRLVRSASLFEDIVKTLCTCNTTWRQTQQVVARLCQCYGPADDVGRAGFPTPANLAAVGDRRLARETRCGYRAAWIHRLAVDAAEGRLDLPALEQQAADPAVPTAELVRRMRQIHGVGPYAAANLCMLLGRYEHLAIDSEMRRLYRTAGPGGRPLSDAGLRARFQPFGPWAFLAYWYELWNDHTVRSVLPV